jgi:hypothetical protein
MPNWRTMYAASSGERAMFLGASGSIVGATSTTGTERPAGT